MTARVEAARRSIRNAIRHAWQLSQRVLSGLILKLLTGTAALGMLVGIAFAFWNWLFEASLLQHWQIVVGICFSAFLGAGALAFFRWVMSPDVEPPKAKAKPTPSLDAVELEAVRYIAGREKFVRCSEIAASLSAMPAGGVVALQHKLNRLAALGILQTQLRATSVEDMRIRYRLGPKGVELL